MTPKPGRRCTVCEHPQLAEIQRLLSEGIPLLDVCSRYGGAIKKSALHRHMQNHTGKRADRPRSARKEAAKSCKSRSESPLGELSPEALKERALNLLETGERIMATAEDANDLRLCLAAHDRTQRALEMLCKVAGLLGPDIVIDQRQQLNIYAGWSTSALEALQIMHDELGAGKSVSEAIHAVQCLDDKTPALPP
jgi:hypothetical protein